MPEVWPMRFRADSSSARFFRPARMARSASCRASWPSPEAAQARWARLIRFVRDRARRSAHLAIRSAIFSFPRARNAISAPPMRSSPAGVRPLPIPIRLAASSDGLRSAPLTIHVTSAADWRGKMRLIRGRAPRRRAGAGTGRQRTAPCIGKVKPEEKRIEPRSQRKFSPMSGSSLILGIKTFSGPRPSAGAPMHASPPPVAT